MFGEAADVYDKTRPAYPVEAIDLIVSDRPTAALDVGCGTGKAARLVIDRGVNVVGIEPDDRMAAVARSHGVEVLCVRFEDWEAASFDCVFSAQAWHWIDPVRGAAKAAEVLSAGGRWVAMWNREDDAEVGDVLERVYKRFAPHLIAERREGPDREYGLVSGVTEGMDAAGAFTPLERHEVTWTDVVTVAHLVARWSTHSGHRLLSAEVADELHESLTIELGGPDRILSPAYTTMVLTSRRR